MVVASNCLPFLIFFIEYSRLSQSEILTFFKHDLNYCKILELELTYLIKNFEKSLLQIYNFSYLIHNIISIFELLHLCFSTNSNMSTL